MLEITLDRGRNPPSLWGMTKEEQKQEAAELIESFEDDVVDGQAWTANQSRWDKVKESRKELLSFIEKLIDSAE